MQLSLADVVHHLQQLMLRPVAILGLPGLTHAELAFLAAQDMNLVWFVLATTSCTGLRCVQRVQTCTQSACPYDCGPGCACLTIS